MNNGARTRSLAVDVQDVSFTWPGPNGYGISIDRFSLEAGSRTLLLGPSGSGKSTLLSLMCGIAVPSRGAIRVLDTDITKLSGSSRDRFRAEHIGIIFQMFNLLPYGSVIDNVCLPLGFAPGRRRRAGATGPVAGEARKLLGALGLEKVQINGPAADLSVGQQQRVAIARALIGQPEVIVADEPTSALDKDRRAVFLDLLMEQVAEAGATLIMVSHDEALGTRFDQVVDLDEIVATRSNP